MPSNSYNINRSPSLPKKNSADESESPQTSSQEDGKQENKENGGIMKSDKNGIMKKKVALGTITLNGVDKNEKWHDNYIPSSTASTNTYSKKANGSVAASHRKPSLDENDENMAKRVTEIFQEVFKEERGNWGLKIEYYMSCIGVPIAFSSLWRFPQLLANYGGGAFLFCYVVLMVLIGLPIYFMESSLGQFSQLSVVHVWRCIPIMQGVGLAMVVLSLITSVYNSQIVAYAVHYFFASFVNMDSTIVWGECKYFWPKCYDVRSNNICSFLNITDEVTIDPKECVDYMIPSSRYYWEEKVLRLTDIGDVGKTGSVHWDLTLCVGFIWLVTFIFLVKGIKSSGKFALVTGFVPISILLAFLVFSVQKNGAVMGLRQFYEPDWDKLAEAEVWQKAAEQVLFSLCVTYGSVLTFSSYKKFRMEIQVGAIALTLANIILSVMAATTIFALYGALASSIGIKDAKSLMETKVSGIEVVFVFVPEVIARLFPFPHIWSIFFFLMLMLFGLHAQFSLVETCLTTVYDALPKLRRRKYLAAGSLILPLFLLSIPLSSSTGLHIHSLIGSSVVGPNVLLIAIFEIFALQCIYGVKRFSRDLTFILKSEPSMFWKVGWVFLAPLTLTVLFVFAVIDWERLLFEGRREDKDWTLFLSWILTLLPLAMIPLTFIFTLFYKLCISEPISQPSPCWGPGCPRLKERILDQRKLLQQKKSNLNGSENEAFNQNQD